MYDIDEAQRRARQRLGRTSHRKRRSDAGKSRLSPYILAELRAAALGPDPPSMSALQRRIAAQCAERGLKGPARASLYNALARMDGHSYAIAHLPAVVGGVLYNLDPSGRVPGHQLAFYCFNYGSIPAVSYAAGLPWLDLYQARRLRGWRPRSAGLIHAVMRARGIR